MSRPLSSILHQSASASGAPKQLSHTEELERLEQSITLTMQEIDHNFSQCHRIITHSIIPIIERYDQHSRDVCGSVTFWKSFFEDSAGLSIGTYESHPEDEATMTTEETYSEHETTDQTETTTASQDQDEQETEDRTITLQDESESDSGDHDLEDESILASMNLTGRDSTVDKSKSRPKSRNGGQETRWADIDSPYDNLRRELKQGQPARKPSVDDSIDASMTPPRLSAGMAALNMNDSKYSSYMDPPTTPETLRHKPSKHHNQSNKLLNSSPASSPFEEQPTIRRPISSHRPNKNDVLLHRAVDTNWRVQLTPQRKTPSTRKYSGAVTPKNRTLHNEFADSSPMSSPAPPQMTTVFSPQRPANKYDYSKPAAKVPKTTIQAPKTPLTSKKSDPKSMTARDLLFDDDDDDDDDFKKLGFSPPVTMQFTIPPSRLLKTPSKEASKMVVNDILKSAGFAAGMSTADDSSTMSPSLLLPKSPTFDFD